VRGCLGQGELDLHTLVWTLRAAFGFRNRVIWEMKLSPHQRAALERQEALFMIHGNECLAPMPTAQ
jgi:hypothetical protein